ncbi:AAA family ATPase [Bradyrhizobium sp. NAS80.1]|uniref:ATP-binding protein n=1 Tax=Bradyrhizobium sp. NAS80.1 TaxID=1680159 RepID=UPI000A05F041|nr:AAA family ATPase [Bradyrhizobium sp. NAS80.1]
MLYLFEDFVLDTDQRELRRDGRPVPLQPQVLDLLEYLIRHRARVVTKDDLISAIWGGRIVSESALTTRINAARTGIGDSGEAQRLIKTLPRKGVRFVGSVHEAAREIDRAVAPPKIEISTQVVGRTASFEMIDQMTRHVLSGKRQMAFVTGEAGIGKTAFIAKTIEQLTELGFDQLYGRCTERFGTDEVFLPLIDALVSRFRANGPELISAVRAHAPTWILQLPGAIDASERAAFQDEVFGATRERMLREFCDLLEALSTSRPWVLVLEDLHWSDFATLDVLSRFARGNGKARVLVLCSYRPVDSSVGGHPIRRLHRDLEIHGCCSELRLDRLSRSEVDRYLALRFDDEEFASSLSKPVFERTLGHPLFVASLLKHLIDQESIVETDGRWRLSSPAAFTQDRIPDSLLNMIGHELDRLTDNERRLLDVASVAGEEFSAALVAAGLSDDAIDVERDIEASTRKDHILVRSGVSEWPDGTYSGSYAFRHILYQNVIYQSLPPGLRAQTHKRLGKRLEEAYAGRTHEIAPALALHLEQGRDFPSALRYLREAAESSTKRLGHAEAASYLTRALDILNRFNAIDKFSTRIALLRQRSWALRSCGDLVGSIRDLRDMITCAEQAGEIKQQLNGLTAVSSLCLRVDRHACLEAAEDVLSRSQALADDTFKALVQGSSASVNLFLNGWREQDATLCDKAIELSAGATNYGTLIRRNGISGIVDCWRSRYQECRRAGTEGKRLARLAGDVYTFVLFNVLESIALIHLGEWRELRHEITAGLELAIKNANGPGSALCRLTLAWLHVEAMDFDGARELCESVDDSLLVGDQSTYFHKRAVLAKAYVGLNDPSGARRQFDDIERRRDEEGIDIEFTAATQVHHCLGEYCLLIGDFAQAQSCARQLHDYVASAPDLNHLAQAHGLLARVALGLSDSAEALLHLSRALEIVDNADFPIASWRVYRTAAEIFAKYGDADRAAAYRIRFVETVRRLAQNFEPEDRLHKSLLAVLATQPAAMNSLPPRPA